MVYCENMPKTSMACQKAMPNAAPDRFLAWDPSWLHLCTAGTCDSAVFPAESTVPVLHSTWTASCSESPSTGKKDNSVSRRTSRMDFILSVSTLKEVWGNPYKWSAPAWLLGADVCITRYAQWLLLWYMFLMEHSKEISREKYCHHSGNMEVKTKLDQAIQLWPNPEKQT